MASELEAQFQQMWSVRERWGFTGTASDPIREWQFALDRKHRFDFAWPSLKVAVELHGGVYTRGRHVRGSGFTNDCEKYTLAASSGWLILHFTSAQLQNPAVVLERIAETLAYISCQMIELKG